MSELPKRVHLPLPRTIIAMSFKSWLMNTSVAYVPHLLMKSSFAPSFIAKLKADQAAFKAAKAAA